MMTKQEIFKKYGRTIMVLGVHAIVTAVINQPTDMINVGPGEFNEMIREFLRDFMQLSYQDQCAVIKRML